MRRLLAVLITFTLALGLGVMSSASAAADESDPDMTTYPQLLTFGGNWGQVVFSPERTTVRVTMTAEIIETSADWIYQNTVVWYGQSRHPLEMQLVSNKLTGSTRKLAYTVDVPSAIGDEVLRWKQYINLRSYYRWKYDTTETLYDVNAESHLIAQGEAIVTLDGPEHTAADHSLELTGTVRCFWLDSYEQPVRHRGVRMVFRADGDDVWQEMGDADYDGVTDTFHYYNPSVRGTGEWRARSDSYDDCYEGFSRSLHVTAVPEVTAPSAPRSPKVTRTSTSVTLSWTPPASNGGAAINAYQVRRGSVEKTLKATARSHTFTGLRPLTGYSLDVRARNSQGWSPWLTATGTTAAPAAKAYPNCSKLNQDYPHGVGKPGAKDKTSTKPVTNFYRSAKVYKMNDGRVKSKKQYDLDRDNDGIACERH